MASGVSRSKGRALRPFQMRGVEELSPRKLGDASFHEINDHGRALMFLGMTASGAKQTLLSATELPLWTRER
jgi:hypothetical protein